MLSKLRKRNWKGFTLIELMIVVAIIGILAAVAIPNFMKFQTKAKQTEAKTNLKAAYVAAKAKYAETSTFATLYLFTASAGGVLAGYSPESNNMYTYGGGFAGDYWACQKCNGLTAAMPAATCTGGGNIATVASTASAFVFNAVANIDTDSFVDGWAIDSSNNMYNSGISAAGSTPSNLEACNDVVY